MRLTVKEKNIQALLQTLNAKGEGVMFDKTIMVTISFWPMKQIEELNILVKEYKCTYEIITRENRSYAQIKSK